MPDRRRSCRRARVSVVVMVVSFSGSDAGHGCSRGPGAVRWSYRVSRAVGPGYSPGCV